MADPKLGVTDGSTMIPVQIVVADAVIGAAGQLGQLLEQRLVAATRQADGATFSSCNAGVIVAYFGYEFVKVVTKKASFCR
jgi:hypothetical protein